MMILVLLLKCCLVIIGVANHGILSDDPNIIPQLCMLLLVFLNGRIHSGLNDNAANDDDDGSKHA